MLRGSGRSAICDVDKPPDRRGLKLVAVTSVTDAVRPPTSVEDTNRAGVGITRRIVVRGDHLVGAVRTHQQVPVDVALESASPDEYDALLLPGGVMNPDHLRMIPRAVEFVRRFAESNKPIAVPAIEVRGSRVFPLIKVYRRLTMGDEEDLRSFYSMVTGRLGKPAQVN